MQTSQYIPGKALILSRLPAQDWFTPDEVAQHSGWSRSFIRNQIRSGVLAAQMFPPLSGSSTGSARAPHLTAKVHVDDLVLFIIRHSNGKITEEKAFRDVASVIRTWPAWMRRELGKYISATLTPSSPPEAGSHVNGTVVMAQKSGMPKSGTKAVRSPGGERAATLTTSQP